MPIPSIKELEARGFHGDAAYHEYQRIFKTLPPQERIDMYVDSIKKYDGISRDIQVAFENAAYCLKDKPYAYDATITLCDRKEEAEDALQRGRAFYENEIVNIRREIRLSEKTETDNP